MSFVGRLFGGGASNNNNEDENNNQGDNDNNRRQSVSEPVSTTQLDHEIRMLLDVGTTAATLQGIYHPDDVARVVAQRRAELGEEPNEEGKQEEETKQDETTPAPTQPMTSSSRRDNDQPMTSSSRRHNTNNSISSSSHRRRRRLTKDYDTPSRPSQDDNRRSSASPRSRSGSDSDTRSYSSGSRSSHSSQWTTSSSDSHSGSSWTPSSDYSRSSRSSRSGDRSGYSSRTPPRRSQQRTPSRDTVTATSGGNTCSTNNRGGNEGGRDDRSFAAGSVGTNSYWTRSSGSSSGASLSTASSSSASNSRRHSRGGVDTRRLDEEKQESKGKVEREHTAATGDTAKTPLRSNVSNEKPPTPLSPEKNQASHPAAASSASPVDANANQSPQTAVSAPVPNTSVPAEDHPPAPPPLAKSTDNSPDPSEERTRGYIRITTPFHDDDMSSVTYASHDSAHSLTSHISESNTSLGMSDSMHIHGGRTPKEIQQEATQQKRSSSIFGSLMGTLFGENAGDMTDGEDGQPDNIPNRRSSTGPFHRLSLINSEINPEEQKRLEEVNRFATEAEIRKSMDLGMSLATLRELFNAADIQRVQARIQEEEGFLRLVEELAAAAEAQKAAAAAVAVAAGDGSISSDAAAKDGQNNDSPRTPTKKKDKDGLDKKAVTPVSAQILKLHNAGAKRSVLDAIFHRREVAKALGEDSSDSESDSSSSSSDSLKTDLKKAKNALPPFKPKVPNKRLSMIEEEGDLSEIDASFRNNNESTSSHIGRQHSGSERRRSSSIISPLLETVEDTDASESQSIELETKADVAPEEANHEEVVAAGASENEQSGPKPVSSKEDEGDNGTDPDKDERNDIKELSAIKTKSLVASSKPISSKEEGKNDTDQDINKHNETEEVSTTKMKSSLASSKPMSAKKEKGNNDTDQDTDKHTETEEVSTTKTKSLLLTSKPEPQSQPIPDEKDTKTKNLARSLFSEDETDNNVQKANQTKAREVVSVDGDEATSSPDTSRIEKGSESIRKSLRGVGRDNDLLTRISSLEALLSSARELNDELEHELAEVSSERKRQKLAQDDLTKKLNVTEDRLLKTTYDLKEQQRMNKKVEQARKELAQQVERLQSELEESKQRPADEVSDMKQAEQTIKALEDEGSYLASKLDKMQSEKQKLESEMESRLLEAQRSIEATESSRAELDGELQALRATKLALEQELITERDKSRSAEETICILESTKESLLDQPLVLSTQKHTAVEKPPDDGAVQIELQQIKQEKAELKSQVNSLLDQAATQAKELAKALEAQESLKADLAAALEKQASSHQTKPEHISTPIPEELVAQVEKGNAHTVDHDPLFGPREPEETDEKERRSSKKKFVSKDQRIKALEASVHDQDIQLQTTLVEMEVLNAEKRSLERKLALQTQELLEIWNQLEANGLVQPSPSLSSSNSHTDADTNQASLGVSREIPNDAMEGETSRAADPVQQSSEPSANIGKEVERNATAQELERLQKSSEDEKSQNQSNLKEIELLSLARDDYKLQLDASVEKTDSLTSKLAVAHDALATTQVELDSTKQQLRTVQESQESLLAEKASMEAELEKSHTAIKRLQAAQGDLQKASALDAEKIANLENERAALQQQLEDLDEKSNAIAASLSEALDGKSYAENQAQQSGAHAVALKSELAEMKSALAETEQSLIDAKGQVSDLENSQAKADKKVNESHSQVAALEAELADLKSTLLATNDSLHDAGEQLSGLEASYASTSAEKNELAKELSKLAEDYAKLKEMHASTDMELQKAKKQVSLSEDELVGLKSSLVDTQQSLQNAKDQIQHLEETKADLEASSADAEAKEQEHIDGLVKDNAELRELKADAERHLQEATHQITALESEVDKLQSSLSSMEQESQGQISALKMECKELKASLSVKEQQSSKQIAALELEVSNLQASLSVSENKLTEAGNEIDGLNLQLSDAKLAIENGQVASKKQVSALEKEVADLKTSLIEMKLSLTTARDKISRLEASFGNASAEKDRLAKENSTLKEICVSTDLALQNAQSELVDLKSELAHTKRSLEDAKNLSHKLQVSSKDASSKHSKISNDLSRLSAENSSLRKAKESAEDTIAQLQTQLAEKDKSVDRTSSELAKLREENEAFKDARIELEDRLDEALKELLSLEEGIEASQAFTSSAWSKADGLEEQLRLALTTNEELSARNKKLSGAKALTEGQLEAAKSRLQTMKLEAGQVTLPPETTSEEAVAASFLPREGPSARDLGGSQTADEKSGSQGDSRQVPVLAIPGSSDQKPVVGIHLRDLGAGDDVQSKDHDRLTNMHLIGVELETLKMIVDEQKKELEGLHSDKEKSDKLIESYKQAIARLESDVADARDETETLEGEKGRSAQKYEADLKESKRIQKDLTTRLQDLTSALHETESGKSRAETLVAKYEGKIQQLESKLNAATEDVREMKTVNANLIEEIWSKQREFESQQEVASSSNAAIMSVLTQAQAETLETEGQVRALLESLQSELSMCMQEREDALSASENHKRMLNEAVKKNENLHDELQSRQADMEAVRIDFNETKQENVALQERLVSFNAMKEKYESLETEHLNAIDSSTKLAKDLTEQLGKLREENETLQSELAKSAVTGVNKKETIGKLENTVGKLETSLRRKRKQLDKIKEENKNLQSNQHLVSQQLAEASEGREHAVQALKTAEGTVKDIQRVLSDENKALKDDIEKLRKELCDTNEDRIDLQQRLEDSVVKMQTVAQEKVKAIEQHQEEVDALKNRIMLLEAKEQRMRKSHAEMTADRDALAEELRSVKDEVTSLKRVAAAQEHDQTEKVAKLERQLQLAVQERDQLEATRSSLQESLKKTASKMNFVQKALSDAASDTYDGVELGKRRRMSPERQDDLFNIVTKSVANFKSICQERDFLQQALDESKGDCDTLRQMIEDKNNSILRLRSSFRAEKKELMSRLLELEGTVEQVTKESTELVEEFNEQKNVLNGQKEGLQHALAKSQAKHKALLQKTHSLEKSLSESMAGVKQLQEAVANQNLSDNDQQELFAANESLKKSLDEAIKAIDSLKGKEQQQREKVNQQHRALIEKERQLKQKSDDVEALNWDLLEARKEKDEAVKLKSAMEAALKEAKASLKQMRDNVAKLDVESHRLRSVLNSRTADEKKSSDVESNIERSAPPPERETAPPEHDVTIPSTGSVKTLTGDTLSSSQTLPSASLKKSISIPDSTKTVVQKGSISTVSSRMEQQLRSYDAAHSTQGSAHEICPEDPEGNVASAVAEAKPTLSAQRSSSRAEEILRQMSALRSNNPAPSYRASGRRSGVGIRQRIEQLRSDPRLEKPLSRPVSFFTSRSQGTMETGPTTSRTRLYSRNSSPRFTQTKELPGSHANRGEDLVASVLGCDSESLPGSTSSRWSKPVRNDTTSTGHVGRRLHPRDGAAPTRRVGDSDKHQREKRSPSAATTATSTPRRSSFIQPPSARISSSLSSTMTSTSESIRDHRDVVPDPTRQPTTTRTTTHPITELLESVYGKTATTSKRTNKMESRGGISTSNGEADRDGNKMKKVSKSSAASNNNATPWWKPRQ